MAISLALIKSAQAKVQTQQREAFKDSFFYPKHVSDGETVDFKVLQPIDGQDYPATILEIGLGEGQSYRQYISQNFPFSADGSCTLVDMLSEAEQSPDNKALFSKITRRKLNIFPVLVLDVKTGAGGKVESCAVRDQEVKLLVLTPKQTETFLDLFDKRGAATDDEQGLFSWKEGKTIQLTRKGKGKNDTTYTFALDASTKPLSIKETQFNVEVDVYAMVKKQIASDDKMTEAVTKYFS